MARRSCCLSSAEWHRCQHSFSGSRASASRDLPSAMAAASHAAASPGSRNSATIGRFAVGSTASRPPRHSEKDVGVLSPTRTLRRRTRPGALAPDGPERHGRRDPHVLRGIGHRVDQQGQGARALGPRQGDEGRRAKGGAESSVPPQTGSSCTCLAAFRKTSVPWCSILSRAWTIAILARQSLSSLSGLTRKRSKAASRSLASSTSAFSPAIAAAAATTRFDRSPMPLPQLGLLLGGERLARGAPGAPPACRRAMRGLPWLRSVAGRRRSCRPADRRPHAVTRRAECKAFHIRTYIRSCRA